MSIKTTRPNSVTNALRALAWMVAHGYQLEISEPEPRGRKGPDHSALRMLTIRVPDPAVFDTARLNMERRFPALPSPPRQDVERGAGLVTRRPSSKLPNPPHS